MRIQVVAALAAALAVAGCATSAENILPQAKRDALRIDTVEVALAPNVNVNWASAWGEYAMRKQNGGEAAASLTAYADEKQYANQKALGVIQKALNAKVPPQFRGSDPTTLKVTLKRVSIPHAIQSILIGGDHEIKASFQLVETQSGRVLLNVDDFNGMVDGPDGALQTLVSQLFPEPIDRVSNAFANSLADWLKTGQALMQGKTT